VAEIFYDDSADLSVIQRRHVAVLGYGSQGNAHAISLRDSGVDVRVGLPSGSASRERAEADRLRLLASAGACEEADLVMALVPDHLQRALYAEGIAPSLVEDDALFFAHGLNIRYHLIQPSTDVDVCMVAPKAPGHLVRRQFTEGRGVPVLVPGRTREGMRRSSARSRTGRSPGNWSRSLTRACPASSSAARPSTPSRSSRSAPSSAR
jgi:ketol-acid reductoisomerase